MGRGTQLNGANYHTPHQQANVPQLNGPAIASLAHILKQQRNTKSRIFMKKVKEKDEVQELFTLAVKRLIARDYSPNKLREYLLKKNKNKKVVDIVIQKLKKYQLLNEDELIERIIEYCDSKHYGYNRIISMLKSREISLNKINNVKLDHQRETKEAIEQAKRLVKRYKSKNTVNLKRNVYSALIRYGFDENIASLESSKVFNSPSSELNMLKLDYSKLVSRYSRKYNGRELNNKVVTSLLSKGYQINDINKIIKEEDKYEIN